MQISLVYLRYQRLVVYGILSFMTIQLLYFGTSLGFVHVILYFLFLLNVDVYKLEYRPKDLEVKISILYLLTVFILILTHLWGNPFHYLYYSLVIILSLYNIGLTIKFKSVFLNKEDEKINSRNQNLLASKGMFIKLYTHTVIFILIAIILLSLYNII